MIRKTLTLLITVFIIAATPAMVQSRELTTEETTTYNADGIRSVELKDISMSDLSYTGVSGTDEFSITFERTLKNGDSEEFDAMLEDLKLDVGRRDDRFIVALIHPDDTSSGGILRRIFKNRDWRCDIAITGPSNVDIDIDAGFSDVRTSTTVGELNADVKFSNSRIMDHLGKLIVRNEFGSVDVGGLDGSFDVRTNFGEVKLTMVNIVGDGAAHASFGKVDIRLPRDANAEFVVDSASFGNIRFNTTESVGWTSVKRGRQMIGNGGVTVHVSSDFGGIDVRNDANSSGGGNHAGIRPNPNALMPLENGAWWRYEGEGGTLTLRADRVRTDMGGTAAELRFTGSGNRPFDRMEIVTKRDGIYISSVNGRFFGRDLSGVNFEPPRLWLPFEGSGQVVVDPVLGTTDRVVVAGTQLTTPAGTFGNTAVYSLVSPQGDSVNLTFVPRIGFAVLDGYRLVAYSFAGREKVETKPSAPEPKFERGPVKSVTVTGARLLTEDDVISLLDIETGTTLSRGDIEKRVNTLNEKHRLIEGAHYEISTDGDLRIRVYEVKPLSHDFKPTVSFTRVGGVGLGGNLTITSVLGPISRIRGGAEYHFANEEWTYDVLAEKNLFNNPRLTIGAKHRLAYESNLDWAIPENDAYLNAFVLGLDTNHYHQVEGTAGYLGLSFGKTANIRGEYFEEEFDSVKKYTNWSFFNARHKKDDNLPLAPSDETRLTGLRGVFELYHSIPLVNSYVSVETEHIIDRVPKVIEGKYNRVLVNSVGTWKIAHDSFLKLRLAGGWADNPLPGPKAFVLGGNNTLRGFDYGSVPGGYPVGSQYGGTRMGLMNVDYYLGQSDVGLVLFADAGGVWLDNRDISIEGIKRDIGIGVDFSSDVISFGDREFNKRGAMDGFRINWAVPVGNEPHVSKWTVNFARAF